MSLSLASLETKQACRALGRRELMDCALACKSLRPCTKTQPLAHRLGEKVQVDIIVVEQVVAGETPDGGHARPSLQKPCKHERILVVEHTHPRAAQPLQAQGLGKDLLCTCLGAAHPPSSPGPLGLAPGVQALLNFLQPCEGAPEASQRGRTELGEAALWRPRSSARSPCQR